MNEVSKAFHIARAVAIDSYAGYEFSLGMLFAHLLGAQQDYAGVTFYKINNAPARLAIIERMLTKRHGSTYKTFWNSLAGPLRRLDEKRNHVVHWKAVHHYATGGGDPTAVTLSPPNLFDRTEGTEDVTLEGLRDFHDRCSFYAKVLMFFYLSLHRPDTVPAALLGIFHQQVPYPPPDNYPLVQTSEGSQSPPPPSSE